MDSTDKLCHRHVAGIKISDGHLIFTLHTKVTISVPYSVLSIEHSLKDTRAEACVYFCLSDDWQKITWPQLGVTLDVNDILNHWMVNPSNGPQQRNAEIEAYISNKETWRPDPLGSSFSAPAEADQNANRQYQRTDNETQTMKLNELCRRVEQLESINNSVNKDHS